MSESPAHRPKAQFTALPNELFLTVVGYLSVRDLRSLARVSRKYHQFLPSKFLFEREVEDERLFEQARHLFLEFYHAKRRLQLRHEVIETWSGSGVTFTHTAMSKDEHAFLNACVDRWGKAVHYMVVHSDFSRLELTHNQDLIDELPVSQLHGSLILRAIAKCSDIQVVEEVIDTYRAIYPESLTGLREKRRWAIFQFFHEHLCLFRRSGPTVSEFMPPVLWACSQNRVDILDLLHRKNHEKDTKAEHKVDFNILVNLPAYWDSYYQHMANTADAWQAAFWHLCKSGYEGQRSSNINEDACLWLLNHNLGFSSRPPGIISKGCLAGAAAHKKLRLLHALLCHYLKDKYMDRRVFMSELVQAVFDIVHHRYRLLGGRKAQDGFDPKYDGHEEAIDLLVGAAHRIDPSLVEFRGNIATRGLLSLAVRWCPRNAVHLARLQMAQGIFTSHGALYTPTAAAETVVFHADLRRALLEAVQWGGRRDTHRLALLRAVFPRHAHLAYRPDEAATPEGRARAYQGLLDAFVSQMWKCFETECYDAARYVVSVAGRERIGEWLAKRLEEEGKPSIDAAS